MTKRLLILLSLLLILLPAMAQNRNSIVLQHNPFAHNYIVEITATKGDGVETPFEYRQSNKIQYTVNVQWITMGPKGMMTVAIDRTSDVYVNDKSSELTVANNIAIRVSDVLYPMVLTYDASGNIKEVDNFDEIKERWQLTKEELLEGFEGEGIDKYIRLANARFSDATALIFALNNDCFLSSFFNNVIYTKYSIKEKVTRNLYVPYLQDTKAVKNTVTFEKKMSDDGIIYIGFDGATTDERSAADLRNESDFPYYTDEPKLEGRCYGAYFLNSTYNTIQSLVLYYTTVIDIEKAISVGVSAIGDSQKPLKEMPIVGSSTSEKIHIPIHIYSDMEKDVQRHLNPLVDIKEMTLPERTHEGITIH